MTTKQLKITSANLAEDYPLTSQFVNGIYGLAKKLSYQIATNKAVDSHDDFFQIMLVEACRLEPKFDPDRGTSFYSFINRPLRAKMFKEFIDVDRGGDNYKKIKEFIKGYQADKHIFPSVEIISDELDIPSDVVRLDYYGKTQTISVDDCDDLLLSDEVDGVNPMDYVKYLEPIEQLVISLLYSEIPEDMADVFTRQYLMITQETLEEIRDISLTKLKGLIDAED